MSIQHEWNDTNRIKTKYWGGGGIYIYIERERTCPIAKLSDRNPNLTNPGSKPGLHSWKPVANHLSYGMDHLVYSNCTYCKCWKIQQDPKCEI
jgi:hypothetical protein